MDSRRLAGLPRYLEPEDVRRLLAAWDRRTLGGCRDFAVITTLACRVGQLVVQGKGRWAERVPLPSPIRCGRRARCVPSPAAGHCTRPYALRAPLRTACAVRSRHGSAHRHRRRATGRVRSRQRAAVAPFRSDAVAPRGVPLSEIQDFLRHARMQTTAIYTKVNRDALRTIARPWPGGVA